MRASLLLSTLALAALPPALSAPQPSSTPISSPPDPAQAPCASGVHIIIARGTFEPAGPGFQSIPAKAIIDAIPGSDINPIDYSAGIALPEGPVRDIKDMLGQATNYSSRCPDTKMVLMGWSQGAQVTADAVSGGGRKWPWGGEAEKTPAFGDGVMKNVAAVILFGDLSHVYDKRYAALDCPRDSIWPRSGEQKAKFGSYADKILSFCNKEDGACCSGSLNIFAHIFYFNDANLKRTVNFVKAKTGES